MTDPDTFSSFYSSIYRYSGLFISTSSFYHTVMVCAADFSVHDAESHVTKLAARKCVKILKEMSQEMFPCTFNSREMS